MPRGDIPPLLDFVGANVQRLRRQRGLTQEDLAAKLSVDPRYLRRVERGTVDLRLTTLARLAWVFGVPAGVLLRRAKAPEVKVGRPKSTKPRSTTSGTR